MIIRTVKDLRKLLSTFRDEARVKIIHSDNEEHWWAECRSLPATAAVKDAVDCELIIDGFARNGYDF